MSAPRVIPPTTTMPILLMLRSSTIRGLMPRARHGLGCLLVSLGCSPDSAPHPVAKAPVVGVETASVTRVDYPSLDVSLRWLPWNAATIARAQRLQRPLLLYVATAGADGMIDGRDELVRSLAEERFVPVRVDPWLHPELDRRYGGHWPALAVVSPEGELIARAVDIAPERVRTFLLRLLDHLAQRPEMIEARLARRRDEVARQDEQGAGVTATGDGGTSMSMPQRVAHAAAEDFDAAYGGFGGPSKHPEATVLDFLQRFDARPPDSGLDAQLDPPSGPRAQPSPAHMVDRSLDAIVASALWGGKEGPFIYADTPRWQLPRREVDAAVVAGLLPVFARQAATRASHRRACQELLRFVSDQLYDAQRGAFASRRLPLSATSWWTDPTLYADRIAYMTLSLYEIEPLLGTRESITRMRKRAAQTLMTMIDDKGAVFHALQDDAPAGASGLLRDQMLVALALTRAGSAAGRQQWSASGLRAWNWARAHLLDEASGGFIDAVKPEGLSRWPRHMPFADDTLPAGNALAARMLRQTGDIAGARRLLKARPLHRPVRAHASVATASLSLRDDS